MPLLFKFPTVFPLFVMPVIDPANVPPLVMLIEELFQVKQ